MKIYGYRAIEKFPDLMLDEDHIPQLHERIDPERFIGKEGLLICHAGVEEIRRLGDDHRLARSIDNGNFIIVGVNGVTLSIEWPSPFLHCVNYGINSPCKDPTIKERFSRLVQRVREAKEPPSAERIEADWWSLIDQPTLSPEVRRKVDEIRPVIRAGSTNDRIRTRYESVVKKYYPKGIPSFSRLRADFESWQIVPRSEWQEQRAHLNHDVFQHEFHHLLAFAISDGIDAVLFNQTLLAWDTIRPSFEQLFGDAVPNALADPTLTLARTRGNPEEVSSRSRELTVQFGEEIQRCVDTARSAMRELNAAVVSALSVAPDEVTLADGQKLMRLSQTFSDAVAGLDKLSVLSRGA